MDLYDKQDELENIVDTLDVLVDDITDKYYIDMINELKYEAQTELEEVNEQISEEEREEMQEENRQYEESRLW